MQPASISTGRRPLAKAVAGFMAAVMFAVVLLASAPGLHRLLHKDSGTEQDQCAICLVAHGQLDSISDTGFQVSTDRPSTRIPAPSGTFESQELGYGVALGQGPPSFVAAL